MAAAASSVSAQAVSFPKSKIKILLLEGIHATAIDLFKHQGFQIESVKQSYTEDELIAAIAGVHALGIRSKTKVTARVLEHENAKHLLSIGCFCIGTDQVNLEAAEKRGVAVFNAPFANTRSVAELIIAEIIMLARQAAERSKELHQGDWRKTAIGCFEIRGKTLGIVGYGHVGSQVSVMAEAMGMQVIFYDHLPKLPLGNSRPFPTLESVIKASDFLTLHVPLTSDTINMITERELEMMKPGSYLLNASRGTVVDVKALSAALRSGKLAGAAVDVFPVEPENNGPGFVSELQGCPNTILTPHIGGSTSEAQAKIGEEVAHSLIKLINNGATTSSVNFPELDVKKRANTHRILNVHKNQPGFLRDINQQLAGFNISAQFLSTTKNIGFMIIDVDVAEGDAESHEVSKEIRRKINSLPGTIRTRLLY